MVKSGRAHRGLVSVINNLGTITQYSRCCTFAVEPVDSAISKAVLYKHAGGIVIAVQAKPTPHSTHHTYMLTFGEFEGGEGLHKVARTGLAGLADNFWFVRNQTHKSI